MLTGDPANSGNAPACSKGKSMSAGFCSKADKAAFPKRETEASDLQTPGLSAFVWNVNPNWDPMLVLPQNFLSI